MRDSTGDIREILANSSTKSFKLNMLMIEQPKDRNQMWKISPSCILEQRAISQRISLQWKM